MLRGRLTISFNPHDTSRHVAPCLAHAVSLPRIKNRLAANDHELAELQAGKVVAGSGPADREAERLEEQDVLEFELGGRGQLDFHRLTRHFGNAF